MTEYIYIVKCDGCEDEMFNFFTDARMQCDLVMSKHPTISQIEIERNDFGECTGHCDLGTVWSWEETMKDVEATDVEPAVSVFTKADLDRVADDKDPEFDSIDNSVDFEPVISEVSAIDDIPDNFKKPVTENFDDFDIGPQSDEFIPAEFGMTDETLWVAENLDGGEIVAACWAVDEDHAYRLLSQAFQERVHGDLRDCYIREAEDNEADYINENPELLAEACKRKPIPEGMTIGQLKEAMEENEDTVECAGCEELFPKEECFHKEGIGYLCGDCEDRIVKCTWCEDLYDKYECGFEYDMGWLCDRCQSAITSRGERLSIITNPTEDDFARVMTEEVEPESVHDLGNEYDGGYPKMQTWVCYFDGVDIGTVEATTEDEALEKMQDEYPEYPYGLRKHDDCWWVEPTDNLTESTLTEALGYDCPKLKEADNNQPGIAKFKILFQFRKDPTVQGSYGDCPYLSGVGRDATFKNVRLIDSARRSYGTIKDIELADNGEVMLTTHEGKSYSLRQALKISSKSTDKFSKAYTILMAIKKAAEAAEKTLNTKQVRNLRVRNALAKLDTAVANEFKAAIIDIVFKIPAHNAYSADDIMDIDPDASEAAAEKAAEKINKIHDDFYTLGFVRQHKEDMENSGMIEDRVPNEKAAWINSSWGAVGKVYFNCTVGELSTQAQEIIKNAKLVDATVDTNAEAVDCYRLATELIRFFNNDPWFYTKPIEPDEPTETEIENPLDLDFPEA